jgi:hypothetical protein
MSRPLDHHHLPVFYLSGWCDPNGKIVRYWRPNAREVKPSTIAPKNTGFEPHLYSLDGYPEDQRQVIEEQFFARVIDDPAAHALKALIEHSPSRLTDDMRVAWTRFLMAARVRSPEMIKKLQSEGRRDMEEALLRDPHEYEAVRREGGPSTLLELAEQVCKPRIDNSGKIVLPGVIPAPQVFRGDPADEVGDARPLDSEARAPYLGSTPDHEARVGRPALHDRVPAPPKIRICCDERPRDGAPPLELGSQRDREGHQREHGRPSRTLRLWQDGRSFGFRREKTPAVRLRGGGTPAHRQK